MKRFCGLQILIVLGFAAVSARGVQVPSEEYAQTVGSIWSKMTAEESEHFILWTEKRDEVLRPYGLETLEKAYVHLGAVLGEHPKEKIRVEIYRTQEDFSFASTLSTETLARSGAIGICKFKRLMILTPEQLAFGYRWRDTLAHELTHFLINEVSKENCPLWFHEGTAKYLETLWRLKDPEYLSPGNRTELVKALKDDELIPFSRMEPSMVYLKDQGEVRLAFSEVAHALHFIDTVNGRDAIRKILVSLSTGKTRDQAFQEVLKMNSEAFEKAWKEFLKNEDLAESPGAAPDKLEIGGDANEIESFTSVNIRGHIRLGDRLRLAQKTESAVLQYAKALEKEPANPVALTKIARAFIDLGRKSDAEIKLETAIHENPGYAPAFLVLGDLLIERSDFGRAKFCFEEANALNPFNPRGHERLVQIYEKLGDVKGLEVEKEALRRLAD